MSGAVQDADAKRCIQRLRRRLAQWEISHLRAVAADLQERLEQAERRAESAEAWGESWQDLAQQLQEERPGVAIGITVTGELVTVDTTGAAS